MHDYRLLTADTGGEFRRLVNEMPRADGPAFLEHDPAITSFWSQLDEVFPKHQFCLVDDDSGTAAGIGNSIPLSFAGDWSQLPDGGLDWALQQGFDDHEAGRQTTIMSALYIEVAATHRGKHVSGAMLSAMRTIAREHGFQRLIAPVRPSAKSRYPLISIDRYLHWLTDDGLPFDPWLRVHVRAGGRALHPCLHAMQVSAPRESWVEWTGMSLPTDGTYVIPHGLVPLTVVDGTGTYIEPGIWVLHEVS